MIRILSSLAAVICLACSPIFIAPAGASDANEIVVTASRYKERYEEVALPHVVLRRRADFAVVSVTIESDSRDLRIRRTELEATLRDLATKAKPSGPVTVALLEDTEDGDAGDTRIKPYALDDALALVRGGDRPDTSRLTILLRTPIAPADTIKEVSARIDAFVRTLAKPGRVSITTGDENLTLVDPGQYRKALVEAIAADAHTVMSALGPNYGVRISGLEGRIAWKRSGDLDLTLYIPHQIVIAPMRSE